MYYISGDITQLLVLLVRYGKDKKKYITGFNISTCPISYEKHSLGR